MKTVIQSLIIAIFLICMGVVPALLLDGRNFIGMFQGFFRLDLIGKLAFSSGMLIGFGVLFFFIYGLESAQLKKKGHEL